MYYIVYANTTSIRNDIKWMLYKRFVHGRNRLYNDMKSSYPGVFDSRDAIGEWLKYQEVNQFFQYQKKPKVVSSMIPRRPFHSLSLDLIDKSNKYILVIIDDFSRYIFVIHLLLNHHP